VILIISSPLKPPIFDASIPVFVAQNTLKTQGFRTKDGRGARRTPPAGAASAETKQQTSWGTILQ